MCGCCPRRPGKLRTLLGDLRGRETENMFLRRSSLAVLIIFGYLLIIGKYWKMIFSHLGRVFFSSVPQLDSQFVLMSFSLILFLCAFYELLDLNDGMVSHGS